jgi:hypothetical protein
MLIHNLKEGLPQTRCYTIGTALCRWFSVARKDLESTQRKHEKWKKCMNANGLTDCILGEGKGGKVTTPIYGDNGDTSGKRFNLIIDLQGDRDWGQCFSAVSQPVSGLQWLVAQLFQLCANVFSFIMTTYYN